MSPDPLNPSFINICKERGAEMEKGGRDICLLIPSTLPLLTYVERGAEMEKEGGIYVS